MFVQKIILDLPLLILIIIRNLILFDVPIYVVHLSLVTVRNNACSLSVSSDSNRTSELIAYFVTNNIIPNLSPRFPFLEHHHQSFISSLIGVFRSGISGNDVPPVGGHDQVLISSLFQFIQVCKVGRQVGHLKP